MLLTKSEAAARKVLLECGLDDINSLVNANLRRLILSRGAYYEEIDLKGKDGRIVTFEGRSIISISSAITDRGKKDSRRPMNLVILKFIKIWQLTQIHTMNCVIGTKAEFTKRKQMNLRLNFLCLLIFSTCNAKIKNLGLN